MSFRIKWVWWSSLICWVIRKEIQDKDEIKQILKMDILKNNISGPSIEELINKLNDDPNNIKIIIELADKYFSWKSLI